MEVDAACVKENRFCLRFILGKAMFAQALIKSSCDAFMRAGKILACK